MRIYLINCPFMPNTCESEEVYGNIALQTEDGSDVGWLEKVKGNEATLELVKGKESGDDFTYVIRGRVADKAGNITEISIDFTTADIPFSPPENLIDHWRFDEGEGNIATNSISAHDGEIFGTKWTFGKFGDALEFDGVDDAVVVKDYPTFDITENMTFMSWFRPTDTLTNRAFIVKQDLWDVETRENITTLGKHWYQSPSLSFSPDGSLLASGSYDGLVKLWDVATRENIATLEEYTDSVLSVSFSPDGTLLALGLAGGTVKFWNVASYLRQLEPEKVAEDVNSDGVVNIQDLVLVASNFGETGESTVDVNADGIVDIRDLVLVAGAFGTAPAAPSLDPQALKMFTAVDVENWLIQAQHLNLPGTTSQKGIRFLEQLLASLIPRETALLANYPNPFNPETWIPYQLAKPADVTLTIYEVNGTLVRTLTLGHQAAGIYHNRSRAAYWDGKNEFGEPVASGVYFYTLTAGDFTATRKMLILK